MRTKNADLKRKLKEYVERFRKAVNLERQAEMEFHLNEIKKLSGKEREKRGRALLNLTFKLTGDMLGDRYIVRVSRDKEFPENEISVGDYVLISDGNPLKFSIGGTVLEKSKHHLLIALDEYPPKWLTKRKVRVDLYANDVTFQRMLKALEKIEKGDIVFDIRYLLLKEKIREEDIMITEFFDKRLNEYQREAVIRALRCNPIYLIHGPPGTGKTVTAVEIIRQLVRMGKRVLVTADSNVAVDNVLERLTEAGVNAIRIGHPARVQEKLRLYSLELYISKFPEYEEVKRIREEITKLRELQEKYLRPIPKYRRGLSDDQILILAEYSRSMRGLKVSQVKSMAEWIKLQRRIEQLKILLKKKLEILYKRAIGEAQVICATNSSAGLDILEGEVFDVLIIDEATQATEPSCLIPLVKAKKVILIGDHKQLPPTILSESAKKILEVTLFERLMGVYGNRYSTLLRVQYRMNEKIMKFSSMMFYDDKLIADESVRNIKMSDKYSTYCPPYDDTPVVLVDVRGAEQQRKGSTSRENIKEARIATEIVANLIKLGVPPEDIAVITPYEDQRNVLRSLLRVKGLEINTVDGFQGREKEVVVLSLVRSNPQGEIGFLKDYRRLNVALTRAKRKLIIIGNVKTLSMDSVYKKLVEYVKKNGIILSDDYILSKTI
ncbi:MAG: IGHMBP2 family helicase [Thermoplasmata archaeon]|nr:MAG: IGHMBP2 family helicase [Thermoplasmata archaeon]